MAKSHVCTLATEQEAILVTLRHDQKRLGIGQCLVETSSLKV